MFLNLKSLSWLNVSTRDVHLHPDQTGKFSGFSLRWFIKVLHFGKKVLLVFSYLTTNFYKNNFGLQQSYILQKWFRHYNNGSSSFPSLPVCKTLSTNILREEFLITMVRSITYGYPIDHRACNYRF